MQMIKKITPYFQVEDNYVKQFVIDIIPVDVNSGVYILTEEEQKVMYFQEYHLIANCNFLTFCQHHSIETENHLTSYFTKKGTAKFLVENDLNIFYGGIILDYLEYYPEYQKTLMLKYDKEIKIRKIAYEKVYSIVGRGAHRWYINLFEECFLSNQNTYLTAAGFEINNIEKILLASRTTIVRNIEKLKIHNIISCEIDGRNIHYLKFNLEFIPANWQSAPSLFSSAFYQDKSSTLHSFTCINSLLKPVKENKKREGNNSSKVNVSQDYIKITENNIKIGDKSEAAAYQYELDRLKDLGVENANDLVVLVSENSTLGYDILSCDLNGKKRFIEVKTVKQTGQYKRFYLTKNELEKSQTLDNYYIYIVIYSNDKPEVAMIHCKNIADSEYFLIRPTEYEVLINY
ncbi:MAG: DUF3883 domain-containing protein [Bacteroidia bacterium]